MTIQFRSKPGIPLGRILVFVISVLVSVIVGDRDKSVEAATVVPREACCSNDAVVVPVVIGYRREPVSRIEEYIVTAAIFWGLGYLTYLAFKDVAR